MRYDQVYDRIDELMFLETARSLERNNRDRSLTYMQAMKDVQKNE